MMNKQEFTKIAKQVLHPRHKRQGVSMVSPRRDWIIGLIVSVGIIGGSMFWGSQMYSQNKNISVDSSNSSGNTATVYREALVNDTLEIYSEREERFDELIDSQPVIVISDSSEISVESVDDVDSETSTTTEEIIDIEAEEGVEEVVEDTPILDEAIIEPLLEEVATSSVEEVVLE